MYVYVYHVEPQSVVFWCTGRPVSMRVHAYTNDIVCVCVCIYIYIYTHTCTNVLITCVCLCTYRYIGGQAFGSSAAILMMMNRQGWEQHNTHCALTKGIYTLLTVRTYVYVMYVLVCAFLTPRCRPWRKLATADRRLSVYANLQQLIGVCLSMPCNSW